MGVGEIEGQPFWVASGLILQNHGTPRPLGAG